jgi:hypothetical protein
MTMRFRNRTLLATVGAIATVLLAGCGQYHASLISGASSGLGSPPLDAALVTPTFGWILTSDRLLVTNDGGKSFLAKGVPLGTSNLRTAYFTDAKHGWIAEATAPTSVSVVQTTDGGLTWRMTSKRTSRFEVGALRIAFNETGRGALMVQRQTSQAFSVADVWTTSDGGVSWQTHKAPAAGEISVSDGGRIALAGGPLHNRVYSTSDDGKSWHSVKTQLSASATTPVLVRSGGVWKLRSAAGLPKGIDRLTYADAKHGWGISAVGSCTANKSNCSLTYAVSSTSDAGATWHQLLGFSQPVS